MLEALKTLFPDCHVVGTGRFIEVMRNDDTGPVVSIGRDEMADCWIVQSNFGENRLIIGTDYKVPTAVRLLLSI